MYIVFIKIIFYVQELECDFILDSISFFFILLFYAKLHLKSWDNNFTKCFHKRIILMCTTKAQIVIKLWVLIYAKPIILGLKFISMYVTTDLRAWIPNIICSDVLLKYTHSIAYRLNDCLYMKDNVMAIYHEFTSRINDELVVNRCCQNSMMP